MARVPFTLRIDQEERTALEHLSALEGRPVNQLLNEAIKTHPNPVLLDFLADGRPVIWVDETLHGLHQDEGVLWLVRRYRLQAALLLFWKSQTSYVN